MYSPPDAYQKLSLNFTLANEDWVYNQALVRCFDCSKWLGKQDRSGLQWPEDTYGPETP